MKKILVLSLLAALLVVSCGGTHFLADSSYRATVHQDYQARMKATGGHFTPAGLSMTAEEQEALEFLYAYIRRNSSWRTCASPCRLGRRWAGTCPSGSSAISCCP